MARTVVLIVLLDSLTDFQDTLNQTLLEKLSLQAKASFKLEECQANITNFVLNKVNYGKTGNPAWITYDKTNFVNFTNRFEEPNSYNKEDLIVNSKFNTPDLEFYSFESVENFIDLNDARRAADKNYNNVVSTRNYSVNNKRSVLENAPFLVAIFETLSNITALTCAGTLLSLHWVITAAACVNVLGDFYSNKTNVTDRSSYTVVAGSTNPVVDGSVHNVTEILLSGGTLENQLYLISKKDPKDKIHLPQLTAHNYSLAMMRIEPGVPMGDMEIWKEDIKEDLDVTVFGWSLIKNDSVEAMRSTPKPAKVTSSRCQGDVFEGRRSSSPLCLSLGRDSENHGEMGPGGAVMVPGRARMLAVLLDERDPMLAEPLAGHAAWIQRVLDGRLNNL